MNSQATSVANATRAYRKNAVMTASREKLIVLLYDGALSNLDKARKAIESKNDAKAGETLSQTFAIVGELRAALDFDQGGELARELNRLYSYALSQLIDANRTRKLEPVANATRVIATLKEGWDGIICAS